MAHYVKILALAGVVELVDTLALGANASNGVQVRVLFPVPSSLFDALQYYMQRDELSEVTSTESFQFSVKQIINLFSIHLNPDELTELEANILNRDQFASRPELVSQLYKFLLEQPLVLRGAIDTIQQGGSRLSTLSTLLDLFFSTKRNHSEFRSLISLYNSYEEILSFADLVKLRDQLYEYNRTHPDHHYKLDNFQAELFRRSQEIGIERIPRIMHELSRIHEDQVSTRIILDKIWSNRPYLTLNMILELIKSVSQIVEFVSDNSVTNSEYVYHFEDFIQDLVTRNFRLQNEDLITDFLAYCQAHQEI